MERMIGCPTFWKCFVACLFLDESQQPTCPQLRQSRRCTQESPILMHSSQTCVCVEVILIWFVCLQVFAITLLSYALGRLWRSFQRRTVPLPQISAGFVTALQEIQQ